MYGHINEFSICLVSDKAGHPQQRPIFPLSGVPYGECDCARRRRPGQLTLLLIQTNRQTYKLTKKQKRQKETKHILVGIEELGLGG